MIKPFFNRGFVFLLHVVSLIGFAYIAWQLALGEFAFASDNILFSGALVLLINSMSIFFHETAHAVVARHYGINLTNVGFRLFLGYPVFYVDTTAAWKLPRQQRINISAAGVLTNYLLTGFAGIALALISSDPLFVLVLSQLVLVNVVFLVVNLLPFVEFDGYYILIDLLKEPDLRTRSIEALVKILKGESCTKKIPPYLLLLR